MSYEKQVTVGGTVFNVYDRGAGRPIVFLHGFPLDYSMWRAQLDALANDARTIAPDLRGFGKSDRTAGTVTMEQFADDLNGLLDALNVTEPIVLCGLSMGGYVAWQFVRKYRRRVCALIACDTRAVADTAEAAAGRRETARNVLSQGSQVVADAMLPKLLSPHTLERQPELADCLRAVMAGTDPEGIAAALLGMAERPDVTADLPAIDVPTLVIVGAEDQISTVEEMRQMAEAIPQAEFCEVPHAGHMAPLENPEAVNSAIRKFCSTFSA
jgi:3-oxoadipate enol-lactonase